MHSQNIAGVPVPDIGSALRDSQLDVSNTGSNIQRLAAGETDPLALVQSVGHDTVRVVNDLSEQTTTTSGIGADLSNGGVTVRAGGVEATANPSDLLNVLDIGHHNGIFGIL